MRAVARHFESLEREFTRRLLAKLREATPVDTHFAQSRWIAINGVIDNDAPYIMRLNDGWSEQAPAGFIERCIDETISEMNIEVNRGFRIQLSGGEIFEYSP